MALLLKKVERPRELKWHQASAMLYGDWGTSKAYVLGLAFAIAGHASFFFLLAMSGLTAIIGFCYIIICKAYPDGGGVYSAVRSRSRLLAVIGALLLIADYVVTASLSSLDAFHYLGVPHPALWAIGALVLIGVINIIGPAQSGNIAAIIAASVVLALVGLVAAVIPHVREVQISVPEGGFFTNWTKFVGIVLALSGVEAIANVTGIMVEPVKRTAKHAILPVLVEVTFISLVLGAAMNSIPGLTGHTEDMIRVIADYFIGPWYGRVIAVVLGLLLLSACNTAIMGLVSILFLMAKDKELPSVFSDLNRYGMPWFGLFVAVGAPILVLGLEHRVEQLAALYAIGVVGAITINLAACCTNFNLGIKKNERLILGAAALVMFLVELTIVYQKHHAVIFASSVLAVGLTARAGAQWLERVRVVVPEVLGINVLTLEEARDLMPLYRGSTLVAVKTASPGLVEEAYFHARGKNESVVYALFVEEKPPGWAYPTEVEPSQASVQILNQVVQEFEKKGITAVPLWNLGDDPGGIIVKTSKELGLDTVMIGATRRTTLERLLKGEVLKKISEQLPQEKHLVICN
ncbi:MAG: universal stress protein [Candidatus Omnitrophica bacterium]|nr:universal stress protein [Candidatus Omnitrophota bacterium]